MIMLFMGFEAFKKKYQLSFGHEASFVTLIGFTISWLFIKDSDNTQFAEMMAFNQQLFFYVCLPPIVFASGFNMQRKDFFANMTNVILFGIVGTFIAFFVFVSGTYLYFNVIAKDGVT
jgi:NhaP-type Na+/H+ or K+/H+ antiporter